MGSCNNLQEGRTEITCLAEGPDRAQQGSLVMTEPDLTQSKRILSFDRRSSFFVLPSSSSHLAARSTAYYGSAAVHTIAYQPDRVRS